MPRSDDVWTRLLAWLRASWPLRCLRAGSGALRIVGWPLFVAALGWAVMATGQGQDGLRLFLSYAFWHHLLAALLLAAWCFFSGYFARANERYVAAAAVASLPAWLRLWAPRLVTLLPAVAVAASLATLPAISAEESSGLPPLGAAGVALALGAAMTLLMIRRSALVNAVLSTAFARFLLAGASERMARDPAARPDDLAKVARGVQLGLASLGLLWPLAMLGAIFWPVAIGQFLGPFLLLLAGSILALAAGFWLGFVASALGLPLVRLLLVGLLLANLFASTAFDSYAVRRVEGQPPPRETLQAAAERWLARQPADRDPTLVLVATAGGGIRAAQWTTTALSALSRRIPAFDEALFAISGVSGGALGASFYVTALNPTATACLEQQPSARGLAERRGLLLAGIGEADFLSPPVYRLFFSELLNQVTPFDVPDRAAALEQAWEGAWSDAWSALTGAPCVRAAGLFAGPFRRLYADARASGHWLPALLLNGTSMGSGQRLVTSAIDLPEPVGLARGLDPFDLLDAVCADLPVSTAANNAARFPLVEPAGLLTLHARCEDAGLTDRIVDGGYFENFGADTARSLLLQLIDALPRALAKEPRRLKLLVVLITSDPDAGEILSSASRIPLASPPAAFADLLGPAFAVYAARTAHGYEAAYRLYETVTQTARLPGSPFATTMMVELNLAADGESQPLVRQAPLGWILTPETARAIAGALAEGAVTTHNRRALERAGRLFEQD